MLGFFSFWGGTPKDTLFIYERQLGLRLDSIWGSVYIHNSFRLRNFPYEIFSKLFLQKEI